MRKFPTLLWLVFLLRSVRGSSFSDTRLPCPNEQLKFLVLINCQTYTHQFCIGVLVTPVWVLTAAACINRVSAANLKDCAILHPVAYNASYQPRREINATALYPAYAPSSAKPLSHNIGLLQLSVPFNLTEDDAELAEFQTQRNFLSKCRHGLIPGSNLKHTKSIRNARLSFVSWYHCCYASIVNSSKCEGYNLKKIDQPNSVCTSNDNYLIKPRDIGTPLICFGDNKNLIVVGVLASSQRGRHCVFTRVDRYFKFLGRITGKKFAFQSEPVDSSNSRNVPYFCLNFLVVVLMLIKTVL